MTIEKFSVEKKSHKGAQRVSPEKRAVEKTPRNAWLSVQHPAPPPCGDRSAAPSAAVAGVLLYAFIFAVFARNACPVYVFITPAPCGFKRL